MDVASPTLFMRAATSPSYLKGTGKKQSVQLKIAGSASTARELMSHQETLMTAQSLLLVVQDDLHQIDLMTNSLGLDESRKNSMSQSPSSRTASQRNSGASAANGDRRSVSLHSFKTPLQTVVVPRRPSGDSTGTNKSRGQTQPPPRGSGASTTSSAAAEATAGPSRSARCSNASAGVVSRRTSRGSQGGVVSVLTPENGTPPGSQVTYTSRRSSSSRGSLSVPASHGTSVKGTPDFPNGAFDPDADTTDAFNTSVRVHPKDKTSAMPRRTSIAVDLLCPSPEELPIQEMAMAAQRFVFAHRKKMFQTEARLDLTQEWLIGSVAIAHDERDARDRLAGLVVSIQEETARYLIYGEYDKFVVFCMDNEPVWRRAARSLQMRKEERLNSTENTFARFAFIDDAIQQKSLEFQEYMDFMVSLKMVEHDEVQMALMKARSRRRSYTIVNRGSPATPRAQDNNNTSQGHHTAERQSRGAGKAAQQQQQQQQQPTPPSGPRPQRPSPRPGGADSTRPPDQGLTRSTVRPPVTGHAHVRADRVTTGAAGPSAHAKPHAGLKPLTSTESAPHYIAPNRPLPPDQWMRVERVPNP